MINKYYINIQLDEINNAGSKAVNDCNQILKNNGVKPYTLNIKKSGNKYLSILNKMIEFEKIKKIEKNSLLFVPHPIYINKKYYIDILKKAKEKPPPRCSKSRPHIGGNDSMQHRRRLALFGCGGLGPAKEN